MLKNGVLLSNVTASQAVHEAYGGVVPELASRAHQQNVVPVVDQALKRAGVEKEQLSAVAFTRGPGLMGSLLVGVSFAKGFARALGIPLIDVNHLQGHVMAHFIKESDDDSHQPPLPFLCLLSLFRHPLLDFLLILRYSFYISPFANCLYSSSSSFLKNLVSPSSSGFSS